MNRRGFLKLLGWSVPATMVLQALPVDGFDSILYQPILPVLEPGSLIQVVDFRTATMRVAKAMHEALSDYDPSIQPLLASGVNYYNNQGVQIIGNMVPTSRGEKIITSQIGVGAADMGLSPGDALDANSLDAYGAALASHAMEQQARVFGALGIPPGCDEAVNAAYNGGPTVRGVIAYNVCEDRIIYRFDVIGGRA